MSAGLDVVILTPQQKDDLVAALVDAIDYNEPVGDPKADAKVARWTDLINTLQKDELS